MRTSRATKSRPSWSGAFLIAIGIIAFAAAPTAAADQHDLSLTIDGPAREVTLGDETSLTITVVNGGSQPTPPTVVHIDVTDPRLTTSVDPEDWTPDLTKPVGVIDPGRSVTVDWTVQPVTPGTFMIYAVALTPGTTDLDASNVLELTVIDRRSLDPSGILPVALGAPAALGALLATQLWRSRRPIDT